MRFNPATFRSLVFTSNIISAIQSLMWILLTLTAILTFKCSFPTLTYNKDGFIPTTLVKLYFEGEECKVNGKPPDCIDVGDVKLTTPLEVFSWMVAFLVVNLIYFMFSIYLFKHREAAGNFLKLLLQLWCISTLVISVMDVVLTGQFVMDYIRILEKDDGKEYKNDITVIPAIMFVVSAKGIALWLISVAHMIYFFVSIGHMNDEKREVNRVEMEKHPALWRMKAYDNHEFKHSSESLSVPKPARPIWMSSETAKGINFYGIKSKNRSSSTDSHEGVTPFNVEESSPRLLRKSPVRAEKPSIKKQTTVYSCDCYNNNILQNKEGTTKHLYQHSCLALHSELEEKLKMFRSPETSKPKKLTDFSHDINNFRPGSGQSKAQARVGFQPQSAPKSSPVPSCIDKDSEFFSM